MSDPLLRELVLRHRDRTPRVLMRKIFMAASEPPNVAAAAEQEDSETLSDLADIMNVVCKFYQVTLIDVLSHRRQRHIVVPRMVFMYLAKTMTLHSYPSIGNFLVGRDHSTIMNGVRRIEASIKTDSDMAADIETLKQRIAA